MEKLYASAISKLLAQGEKEDALVQNLVSHLKATGRVKLLPAILRELKKVLFRNRTSADTVEVARKEDGVRALKEAASLGITADEAVVNPLLISGWRARTKGTLVDHSGKRALTDMYQRIAKV